jgi:biofilm PGA synthesis N-glycosyltransferase PgaC
LFITFFFLLIFINFRNRKEGKTAEPQNATFVIPAFNAADCIERTIDSIFNLDYPQDKIRIIVVNDGSTDNTLNVLKRMAKKHSNLRILSKKNEGKAVALNYGIKQVKTPITVILDADTLPERDLLRKAAAQLEDRKIMAVTCRIIPVNRNRFLERMQIIEYAFTSFYRKLLHYTSALQTTPAFTLFRTEFFKRFGYFDPGNLTEDMDMGMRVQLNNYDIGYVFDSYAVTLVPPNFKSLARQRIRWSYGTLYNLYKFRKMLSPKYGDLGLFFLPSILVSVLILFLIISLAAYNFVDSTLNLFHRLSLGWRPSFLDFNTFSIILSLTDLKIILGAFVFILAFGVLLLIRHEVKENISVIDWILYLFIYIWILAYFYIVALFSFLTKKPQW